MKNPTSRSSLRAFGISMAANAFVAAILASSTDWSFSCCVMSALARSRIANILIKGGGFVTGWQANGWADSQQRSGEACMGNPKDMQVGQRVRRAVSSPSPPRNELSFQFGSTTIFTLPAVRGGNEARNPDPGVDGKRSWELDKEV